ncbi:hypothetical protein AAFF_G00081140 [Aldrovandia affinis]|uniref:Uncharacterized protein n=1 Tax=Aldrovandia affinis TaxID=143900 RepID=A0AAD7WYA3_9TELE|nr:hypothetical protein AAFF_G00081140 [Aldrovandia affinis]
MAKDGEQETEAPTGPLQGICNHGNMLRRAAVYTELSRGFKVLWRGQQWCLSADILQLEGEALEGRRPAPHYGDKLWHQKLSLTPPPPVPALATLPEHHPIQTPSLPSKA